MAGLKPSDGLLEQVAAYTAEAVSAVTVDDLSAPTPCAQWDLFTLLLHVDDSLGILIEGLEDGGVAVPAPGTATGRRPRPGSAAPVTTNGLWTASERRDDARGPAPRTGDRLRRAESAPWRPPAVPPPRPPPVRPGAGAGAARPPGAPDLLGGDIGGVIAAAVLYRIERLVRAHEAVREGRGPDHVTVGDRPLPCEVVAATGAIEIAVHAWDVAAARGQVLPIPDILAAELLDLSVLLVDGSGRPGLFAAAVSTPARARPGDRLVALLGRTPR